MIIHKNGKRLMDLCKGHANSLRVVPVLVSVLTEGAQKVIFNIIRDILRNCNPPNYWKIKECSTAPTSPAHLSKGRRDKTQSSTLLNVTCLET